VASTDLQTVAIDDPCCFWAKRSCEWFANGVNDQSGRSPSTTPGLDGTGPFLASRGMPLTATELLEVGIASLTRSSITLTLLACRVVEG